MIKDRAARSGSTPGGRYPWSEMIVVQPDLRYPDTVKRDAAGIALEGYPLRSVAAHAHRKAELVHLLAGNLTVQSADGIWVVPPGRALWIPPGVLHASLETGDVRAQCIFFDPGLAALLHSKCHLIFVHPLLREILDRLTQLTATATVEADTGKREERLVAVLLDELAAARTEPFHLPLPADPRLQKIVRSLLHNPSLRISIASWSAEVGTSPRTLARLFHNGVGMSLGKWRQQLHVQIALRELERGVTVNSIAYDLGYDSPSAFIAMFKRNTGQTPGSLLSPGKPAI